MIVFSRQFIGGFQCHALIDFGVPLRKPSEESASECVCVGLVGVLSEETAGKWTVCLMHTQAIEYTVVDLLGDSHSPISFSNVLGQGRSFSLGQ